MSFDNKYEKGITLTFTPHKDNIELDPDCTETICTKLNKFLIEEEIYEKFSDTQISWISTSYDNKFKGGPLFLAKHYNDKEWTARLSSGSVKFIDFKLTIEEDYNNVEIVNHNFKEEDYSCLNVEEWFEGTLRGIKAAQERRSFEWNDNKKVAKAAEMAREKEEKEKEAEEKKKEQK